MAIMGPSGCGKSTLLNILGTLEFVDHGDVVLNGKSISSGFPDDFAESRREDIGFVFQKHHLLPQLTALENVLLPTLKANKDFTSKALELLKRVGLEDRQHHRPGQMSGGECQRVALCRALINSPQILLADEPTGALDSENAERLSKLIMELNREYGLTVIIVTHSLEFAEKMSIIYKLVDGSLRKA